MIFKFFKFLKKENIDFCIINGYEDIVAKVDTDSDIDILFKQDDFNVIQETIKDFCREENILIVQMLHHDILAKNFFIYNPQNGEYLNLDLYAELSRKGIVYFNEEEVFSTLKSYEDIPILSPEKEFLNYFIKKLDKDDFTERNFNNLRTLYVASEALCIEKLNMFFLEYGNIIVQAFKDNNFTLIKQENRKVIKDFYSLKSNNISRKFLNLIRITKRVFKSTGLSVAFLGPDGAGKSTIINNILENKMPFRRKDYFHLKPIVPKGHSVSVVDNPHEMPIYSKLKSYIKLLYFIYQYNLGWIKNISKLRIKSSLIIFDRYYDDLLVDNKRYRYGGSILFARLVRLFIPKPDMYFILTTDAKIIYARKQEVSFEELERQVIGYRELTDDKKYFNIDVNKNPEDITREIILIIMGKMNERY